MADTAEVIYLSWDSNGRITHKIEGSSFGQNPEYWTLSPSAPALLAHQLGTLRPSYGLVLCSKILDIIIRDKYITTPINTTLQSARIEFINKQNKSIGIKYIPIHPIIHNNDSLEEGSVQLVSNYFYYVLRRMGYHGQLVIKSFTGATLDSYFDTLEKLLSNQKIGPNKDKWDISMSIDATGLIKVLLEQYLAPDEWKDDPYASGKLKEFEEGVIFSLKEKLPALEIRHQGLCKTMFI